MIMLSLSAGTIAIIAAVIILSIVGIAGAMVPAIPGTPLNMVALLIAYFAFPGIISTGLLIALLVAAAIVIILDYIAPIWLTKVGGGSKKAILGSTVGLFAGLLFMPVGLIVGPLAGAFIGELISGTDINKAIKVSLWSFVAFLLTTGLKLMAGLIISFYTLQAAYVHLEAAI